MSRDFIKEARERAKQKKMHDFDYDKFRILLWTIFIAADLLESSSVDLADQMKSIGAYMHDDKRKVKEIRRLSGSCVKYVYKMFKEAFEEKFGYLSDEGMEMLHAYIKNKYTPIKKLEVIEL